MGGIKIRKEIIGILGASLIIAIGAILLYNSYRNKLIEIDVTPSSPGIKIDLSLSKPLGLGDTGIITTTVESIIDIYDVEVKILLPDGFELLDGDLVWKGALIIPEEEKEKHPLPPTNCAGAECRRLWEEYKYPSVGLTTNRVVVRTIREGNWTIQATIQAGGPNDPQSFNKKDFIYISVLKDKAIIYDEPFPVPAEPCEDVYLDGELIKCLSECPPGCEQLADKNCYCT